MTHTWTQGFFVVAAVAVLSAHLFFNAWYVFGAVLTKNRPRLEVLHILTLIYGVIAENATFTCPLTLLEKFCQVHAGLAPYHGPFELHYMRAVVAPSFPLWLLEYGAIGVFLVNVAIYARRFALHYAQTHRPAH
ncbi:MAG TPA: DUF2784 family protein [Candidatus Acidoferrales bacterium]|nr:DUF2784 family protein [Candidatus Acidoferrales bacterium]